MRLISFSLLALCLVGAPAAAQERERVYWGFSNSGSELEEESIKRDRSDYAQKTLGWRNTRTLLDESLDGPKLYRGVVNDRYTATEVGIASLGEISFVTDGFDSGNQNRRMYEERRSEAIYIDKIKYWGASDTFKLFARAGLALVKTEVETRVQVSNAPDPRNTYKETEIVFKAGAGLQWRVTDAWHVRTEMENYFGVGKGGNISQSDITVFSLGVLRLF